MASRMVMSSWIMAILGVIVIVHGTVLLTPYAGRIGGASGPLMIVYAIVMLLNQLLLATGMLDDGSGMGMTNTMGQTGMTAGMSWDGGMVSLAVLMLLSGIIMTRNREMGSSSDLM